MARLSEAFQIAVQYHRAGRLELVEEICRRILSVEPGHAESLHLLGILAHQTGRQALAAQFIGRAIAINPAEAKYHNNLGEVLRALGRIDEALACYRRALEFWPEFAEAHSSLGSALQSIGSLEEAADCYRRALQLKPGFAQAHFNLGTLHQQQGDLDQAIASYAHALQWQPSHPGAHRNLGSVRRQQGRLAEAVACFRRAIECQPTLAEAWNDLGVILAEQGTLGEAIACLQRAVQLQPGMAETHHNLGEALSRQGRIAEAIASLRRAVELMPDHADAHNGLGNALKEAAAPSEAAACYRRALAAQPDHVAALTNLGVVLTELGQLDEALDRLSRARQLGPDDSAVCDNLGNALRACGQLDEAIACYRRAMELEPGNRHAHSNFLHALQYCDGVTLADLAEAHAAYDRSHAAPLRAAWCSHHNSREPDRPLRLGFVSADLRRHPVGYFALGAIENLDPSQACAVCYSDRPAADDLTARFRAGAALWRETFGVSDAELCEQIRTDEIDVLFDLAGHTAGNRLLVFARRPAPLQVSWIGYEGTTGLKAIDYVLADGCLVPESAERHYAERVLRMPHGFVTFSIAAEAPPAGDLPARTAGHVTFVSCSNPAKISDMTIAAWARVLLRLPESRLLLRYRGLDSRAARTRLGDRLAAKGIEPERWETVGAAPYHDYLVGYQRADLVLDPLPFSGGATTCEALWMGVPVVTCPGETFASRHSLSHLSNVGLTETIAGDIDEYVEIAVRLASDLPRLAEIRASLRPQMAASPLCDGKRFAENLMQLLRGVWREWCNRSTES